MSAEHLSCRLSIRADIRKYEKRNPQVKEERMKIKKIENCINKTDFEWRMRKTRAQGAQDNKIVNDFLIRKGPLELIWRVISADRRSL